MKKNILVLVLIFISSLGVFGQKIRTTAVFDADTSTRPKAGFYGIGVRGNMPFLVKNTGNTIRFGMVSSFGTNYIPKFNSSGSFVNSLAFDNGTNFTIGTNTNIDSYSRLYVFGGANGANIDARPGGGGYDQSIFDAQGSDYATTFHSAHLRYQGIGAAGTTFGYSNANLADLSYNYTGSNRAFIIRSLYNNPIVFGVDNTQVARLQSTGLHLSNLTTNYLTKHTTGGLANSQIFDNGTNVGIGTTSPSYTLDVNGSTQIQNELILSTNNAAFRLYRTTGTNYFDWSSGQDLRFSTVTSIGGSSRSTAVTFNSSGNVGIGTTSPQQKTHINTSLGGVPVGLYLTNDATNATIGQGVGLLFGGTGNTNLAQIEAQTTTASNNTGGLMFKTSTAGTLTERMRLDENGKLGIGTTAPGTANLYIARGMTGGTAAFGQLISSPVQSDVTGAAYGIYTQANTAAAAFTLGNYTHYVATQNPTLGAGSAITTQEGFTVSSTLIGASNNRGFRGSIPSGTNRFNLYMDGTAQNYIEGNVGIGTSIPSYKLHIESSSDGFLQYIRRVSGTNNPLYAVNINEASSLVTIHASASTAASMAFAVNGTERVRINGSGNVGIGTTAPTSKLQVVGLPVYADNAAATSGGLTAGAFYRTSTGVLMVVY